MVKKIEVTLQQHEYSALLDLSIDDLRNPSDQLRHILRMEIERRLDNNRYRNSDENKSTKKKN